MKPGDKVLINGEIVAITQTKVSTRCTVRICTEKNKASWTTIEVSAEQIKEWK